MTSKTGFPKGGALLYQKLDHNPRSKFFRSIDLLAILPESLDRALFLYIFIHEVRLRGVRACITIVHIRKFCKM